MVDPNVGGGALLAPSRDGWMTEIPDRTAVSVLWIFGPRLWRIYT
jgi:hypothetical protein